MSSRNRYLDGAERGRAPALHAALERVREGLRAGVADRAALVSAARAELEQYGFRPDYVEIRRAENLAQPRGERGEALVVLGAAWLGRARLIDNLVV
jgi:pantoate--beta-alanine ligase